MIEHFAAIDGEPVPAMTDPNSIHVIQADLLKNSPNMIWPNLPTNLKVAKDGTIQRKVGRPLKNRSRTNKLLNKYYNLLFRGGRTYRLTLYSLSEVECHVEKDVYAVSLRKLLSLIAGEICKFQKPKSAQHFTVTLKAYPKNEAPILHTETVQVLEVESLHGPVEAPIMQHGALDEGLVL